MKISVCADCMVDILKRNPLWPITQAGAVYKECKKGTKRCYACGEVKP